MTAASGLLRPRLWGASDPCPTEQGVLCPLPYKLGQFPSNVFSPSWPDLTLKRPLWSELLKPGNSQFDSVVADLRRAYRQMAAYDSLDPRSLLYQASLHRYYCGHDGGEQSLPPTVRGIHDNWAFLPWHRAFIYFHERLIQHESGNPKFRLPVWDWETSFGHQVPAVYNDLGPIQDPKCKCQRRTSIPPIRACTIQAWLQCDFTAFVGTDTEPPAAQSGPHSTVHVKLGGYMSALQTAAADPVFYAHHANIDRFWLHWRTMHDQQNLPDVQAGKQFYFFDFPIGQNPKPVVVTAHDFEDISKLGYTYDSPAYTFADVTLVNATKTGSQGILTLEAGAVDKFSAWLQNVFPFVPVEDFRDWLTNGAQSASLAALGMLAVATNLMLPVRVGFKLPKVQPGRFYLIGFKAPDQPVGDAEIIGGFGAFTHHTAETRFNAAACFKAPQLIRFLEILSKAHGFQLVCGPAKQDFSDDRLDAVTAIENGQLVIVNPVFFEIQLPKS